MGLEDLVVGLAAAAAFMGSAVIVDVSSIALDEEEVSSAIFNNLLLLPLFPLKLAKDLFLAFFSSFSPLQKAWI